MLNELIKENESVYINDIRKKFNSINEENVSQIYFVLDILGNKKRYFELKIPALNTINKNEIDFIKKYLTAEIYNILVCLGGTLMSVYIDKEDLELNNLLNQIIKFFQINQKRHQRNKFGKCVNVLERTNEALTGQKNNFNIIIKEKKSLNLNIKHDGKSQKNNKSTIDFKNIINKTKNNLYCGLDIGGTSIKAAVIENGKIINLKRFYWHPSEFRNIDQLINHIEVIISFMRNYVSLKNEKNVEESVKKTQLSIMDQKFGEKSTYEDIKNIIEISANYIQEYNNFDGIGVGFPDVVVKNKIVGGEVYKTRGIRKSLGKEYRNEFPKLSNLNKKLLDYCNKGGKVNILNDAHLAAFTAAVEMNSKNGMFVHTLGTELGTGWVNSEGKIPDYPLESYHIIIDLGNINSELYPSDDLRSNRNFVTEIPGTVQQYVGQSGVFRLIINILSKEKPDLYNELFEKGFINKNEKGIFVQNEPRDMRNEFLRYIITRCNEKKEDFSIDIFTKIGEYLAVLCEEEERIYQNVPSEKVLFGGLVAVDYCAELIISGAKNINKEINLKVANDLIANTYLMKQLKDDFGYAVSSFGQAIGAVYYAAEDN